MKKLITTGVMVFIVLLVVALISAFLPVVGIFIFCLLIAGALLYVNEIEKDHEKRISALEERLGIVSPKDEKTKAEDLAENSPVWTKLNDEE